jgi:hypothetical protein
MPEIRPTPLVLGIAAGVAVALFGLAFLLAGAGASPEPAKPAGEVVVAAPAPARVATLRPIGSIPPAPAPRKPKKKKKAAPKRRPPATIPPPVVTPPPVATRPPPPPPPGSDCVGALCP